MNKKFVASFMTALMAAMTLVSPALGATALNTYPTFLGKVGDFYVVVGEKAAAEDVAGAIDIAANLAQLSYKDTTTSGTTTSAGTTDRKVVIPASSSAGQIAGSSSYQLPSTLRNFHYTGLKETKFQYRGTDHSYHESVVLPTSGATLSLTHTLGSPVNGTLKMRIDNNGVDYRYNFDDTIASADFSATAANTTTYTNPLKITLAGKEFQIVAVPDTTSFKALVGTVKTLSDGESMTVGDLTLKVVQSFSSTTAKVEITDSSGNVVKSGINTGSTESVTFGGSTYNYKVLSSGATASGVLGYAQVLFGKGDVEKTFDGSTTATVSDWGDNWVISGSFTSGAGGRIVSGDYISVKYNPQSLTDATRYYLAGSTFQGPGNYFELKYAGYYPGNFAKVKIEPVTGQTIYNSTTATGYSTTTSLNGLKVWTDLTDGGVAGTIVSGSTGYDEMYILFNASAQATSWNTTFYWMAYKDKSTGRIVNLNVTQFPAKFTEGPDDTINVTDAQGTNIYASKQPSVPLVNVTLSYGGPGAQASYTLGTSFDVLNLFNNTGIYNATGTVKSIAMAFQNRTIASTTTGPELILGTGVGTADTNDVQARVENTLSDVATQVGNLITDDGVQIYSTKSNVETNKVILGIPPEPVYGLIQFGKTTSTTTAGTTIKEVVAITTAVAKLDTEVGTAEKAKSLVSVGGPCVNKVTAAAMNKTYPACGTASGISANSAIIQVFDGTYTTGKSVVVVAGWEAKDTRLASSVLQSYASKLSSITASKVTVSGTTLATATITAA